MQPESHHAAPEEERNFSGFRILPSGAPVTDTPPFDRLFEEGAGNGLYALAVSNWETAPDPGAFFIKNMARQALTRMAHALSLIHISEPTRLGMISYAVFCLKKKKKKIKTITYNSQQE